MVAVVSFGRECLSCMERSLWCVTRLGGERAREGPNNNSLSFGNAAALKKKISTRREGRL